MMKILFLTFRDIKNPSSVGGDYYLWELAKGLAQLKHKVTLVCNRFEGSKDKEVINQVEVIRVKGFLSAPFKIFRMYLKQLKRDCDIVIEEAIGGQRLPYLAGVYIKKPLIAVWHQKHSKIFQEQYPYPVSVFLSFLERFLAKLYRNRIIITPSLGAKKKLLTLGFLQKNVQVIYDGVGKTFQSPNTNRMRENSIVCLGKFRKYKRFDHAILAFKKALEHIDADSKLIVAGKISIIDRGYVYWLSELAERLNIREKVEFRFNITEKEKLNLLEKAKILVQPSPIEGFSIVVAEANRCGTPVVTSDGIPRDVVIHGYNGLVYSFNDIEASATAIISLIKDENLWKRMSKNALKWSQQFTWKKSIERFQKYLEKMEQLMKLNKNPL
jgi:glycosyltransferase involved in cell wall biosynthesis